MGEKLRIYVGGLGPRVQASDLEKTFTSPQLGAVQSVEIIRTKSRSFAYLEFAPASDKGLGKLFSTHNGCMWKGGKLKLEKAKENYLSRLKREWTEDNQLNTKLSGQKVDTDESVYSLLKPKKDHDIEKMQLKMFFPKLRKIKAIPLKGTGKHKYSFQRIIIPPLPIHFCDCEEHSGHPEPPNRNHSGLPEPTKRNITNDLDIENCGVNEQELDMMKSILVKVLEKEIPSVIVTTEAKLTKVGEQVDEEEEDQVSDEDNLLINIVGRSSKRVASFEDWGLKTCIANQVSLVSESKSSSNTNPLMQATERANRIHRKRKQPAREDESNGTVPSKKKGRKGDSHDSIYDRAVINTIPIDKESGSVGLTCRVASSNKSAWKALVSEGSTAFNISDILMNHSSDVETKPGSDPASESSLNKNDNQQEQTTKQKGLEKLSDVQSTRPTVSADLLARGSSWKQKSSWLQLVADANTSAFNLLQILPDVNFQKKESQEFNDTGFSYWGREKKHTFEHEYENSHFEDTVEPQGPTTRNMSDNVLTKGWGNGPIGSELLKSDTEDKVEVIESSASVLGIGLVPDNRAMGEIVISETCPFMRSSASMKEWAKSKAALSGSHKKKGKGKEAAQD